MASSVSLSHASGTVRDLDEAVEFYCGGVGLEIKTDMKFGEGRWLTVGAPSQEGIEIALETQTGRPGDEEPLARVIAAGSLTAAIFKVEDCNAIFDKLKSLGAPIVQEPADQPYGVRDCARRDPSGNMVRFSQPLGPASNKAT